MKLEIRPSNIGTNIRLITAMFMIIDGRVHWTLKLTSSYLKTSVFDRPHEYDKSPFLKIYSLESVFENLRICCRIRRFRVDGSRIRRKKSPFLKISGYVWTGPQFPLENLLNKRLLLIIVFRHVYSSSVSIVFEF